MAVLQLGRAGLQPRGITSTFNKSGQRERAKAKLTKDTPNNGSPVSKRLA